MPFQYINSSFLLDKNPAIYKRTAIDNSVDLRICLQSYFEGYYLSSRRDSQNSKAMPNNIARMAHFPSFTPPLPVLGTKRSVQSFSVIQSHIITFNGVICDRPCLSVTLTFTVYGPNGGSF